MMREGLSIEQLKSIYNRISHRYDFQHALITGRSDWRGRRMVVEKAVKPGDSILDCGAGTGSTSILAARKAGPRGHVTLFDLSGGMLEVAKEKAEESGLEDLLSFCAGDMLYLPFEDGSFDAVLSTYSMCPLYDPAKGALELYRVLKPGGLMGVAHSSESSNAFIRWIANLIEGAAWHFKTISMGCRAVTVLPALEKAGAKVIFHKYFGVPFWPFEVFVVDKP